MAERMETIGAPPKMRAPKKKKPAKEGEWKIHNVYIRAHVRGDISFARADTDQDDNPHVVFEEFDSLEEAIEFWGTFAREHDSEIADRIHHFLHTDLLAWRCRYTGEPLPEHLQPVPRDEDSPGIEISEKTLRILKRLEALDNEPEA